MNTDLANLSSDITSKTGSVSLPLPEYEPKTENKTFLGKIQSLPEKIPAFGLLCALIGKLTKQILYEFDNLTWWSASSSGVTMFSLASLIVKLLTELHAVEILVLR